MGQAESSEAAARETELDVAANAAVESALQAWNVLICDEQPQSLFYLCMLDTDQRVVLSFSNNTMDDVEYFENGKWTTSESEILTEIDNISFALNETNAYKIDHMLGTICFRFSATRAVQNRAYTIILGMLEELHPRSEAQVTDMQLLLDLIIERHADTHISIG
jgi:hypothetical protein